MWRKQLSARSQRKVQLRLEARSPWWWLRLISSRWTRLEPSGHACLVFYNIATHIHLPTCPPPQRAKDGRGSAMKKGGSSPYFRAATFWNSHTLSSLLARWLFLLYIVFFWLTR
eukprot:RCo036437